jgi:hypothetical protein
MKKSWLILCLSVIIVFQFSVLSSFQSEGAVSHTSGTRAVVVAKVNYLSLRATIQIYPEIHPGATPVFVTFSNGSQIEITEKHSIQILLPKTGSLTGTFYFSDVLRIGSLPSREFPEMPISSETPMAVNIIPDVTEDFIQWGYEAFSSGGDVRSKIDIYWLIVEGDATVAVSGYGAPI